MNVALSLNSIFSSVYYNEKLKNNLIRSVVLTALLIALAVFCHSAANSHNDFYDEDTYDFSSSATPVSGVTSAMTVNLNDFSVNTKDVELSSFGYNNLGIVSIADGHLNIRESASTDSAVVGKMNNNAACEILSIDGDFANISSGDVKGYIKTDYLLTGIDAKKKAAEIISNVATITADSVCIRSGASTSSEVIGSGSNGFDFDVLGEEGDFIKIDFDGEDGYVSKQYATVSEKLPEAISISEFKYGAGVSDVRSQLVEYAMQFVGNRYVWGGTSLTKGADCSGFVMSVFAKYGIYLPHSSRAQANYGKTISASEAKPGDLFFYGRGKKGRINHVGIYIGNGLIVNAASKKSGIKISNAYGRTPVKVTRLLD